MRRWTAISAFKDGNHRTGSASRAGRRRYIEEVQNMTGPACDQGLFHKNRGRCRAGIRSPADYILLDQGGRREPEKPLTGALFPAGERSPIFPGRRNRLAAKTGEAIHLLHPWAVDLSSSLETDGKKTRQNPAIVRMLKQNCKHIRKERESRFKEE